MCNIWILTQNLATKGTQEITEITEMRIASDSLSAESD